MMLLLIRVEMHLLGWHLLESWLAAHVTRRFLLLLFRLPLGLILLLLSLPVGPLYLSMEPVYPALDQRLLLLIDFEGQVHLILLRHP